MKLLFVIPTKMTKKKNNLQYYAKKDPIFVVNAKNAETGKFESIKKEGRSTSE